MKRNTYILALLLLGSMLLAACGQGGNGTEVETPQTEEQAPADESAAFRPVDAATCEEMRAATAERLGINVDRSEAPVPFQDTVSGQSGTSCQIFASATGETFPSFVEIATRLSTLLNEEGWEDDMQYLADGPTGTMSGYRRGNELTVMRVEWFPSGDANCPADQPIIECAENLEPHQMHYSIVIDMVQR